MNKLAYHYNKKKIPATTEGKYLYYYPCEDPKQATVQIDGQKFAIVEVTEKEWEALVELDRIDYNSQHKYTRHTTPMPEGPEDELPAGQQERLHFDDVPIPEVAAEKTDKQALVAKLSSKEQQYVKLLNSGHTQKQIAAEFGVSQGYVSMVKRQAQYNLDYQEYRAAVQSNDPKYVWKCWKQFSSKLAMPMFLDIELDYVIGCLHPNDIAHFLYWYYSIGELVRYMLTYYLYKEEDIAKEKAIYLSKATDQELAWFYANYEDEVPLVQIVYIRLIDEVERRRLVGMQGSNQAAENFHATIAKLAKAENIEPHDYYAYRIYPILATIHNRRAREFYRFYTGKKLLAKNN